MISNHFLLLTFQNLTEFLHQIQGKRCLILIICWGQCLLVIHYSSKRVRMRAYSYFQKCILMIMDEFGKCYPTIFLNMAKGKKIMLLILPSQCFCFHVKGDLDLRCTGAPWLWYRTRLRVGRGVPRSVTLCSYILGSFPKNCFISYFSWCCCSIDCMHERTELS